MTREFIKQADPGVCQLELAAVLHASMLDDGIDCSVRTTLADLAECPSGSRSADRAKCPVGTVEFCRAWMRAAGVSEPQPLDYPSSLRPYLERDVRRLTRCGDARPGDWIKPVTTKAWAAERVSPAGLSPGLRARGPAWSSKHLDILAEWRVYVLDGGILAASRYDDGPNEMLEFDDALIAQMVADFGASGEAPTAYALDVARLTNGRTALVEVNDAWALGLYRGLRPRDYADMLWSRWSELLEAAPQERPEMATSL